MAINFWEDEEGEEIEQQEKFSSGGGDFEVIPAKTVLLADIESIEYQNYKDSDIQYINVQWRATKPELYANRIILQKIRIKGDDPESKDYKADKQREKIRKAKTMLAAIDKICTGGKLYELKDAPTDENLQRYLLGGSCVITVQVWKGADENGNQVPMGNWVQEVAAPKGGQTKKPSPAPTAKPPLKDHKKAKEEFVSDIDEDIPF